MMSLLITVSIAILSLQYNTVMTLFIRPPEPLNNNLFARDLLPFMFNNRTTENVVYSPASIYNSLALTYMGAEGHTADELRKVLRLEQTYKTYFASKYGDFSKTTLTKTKSDKNAPKIPMISRLYVSSNIRVNEAFSKIARKNFNCETQYIDFSHVSMAAENINKWVQQQTENKIKNIIQPNAINSNTSAILLNAIYFEARWLHPFLSQYTRKANFHINNSKKVKMDFMFANEQFAYFKSSELNAQILEMPYENSDISMLIILPDETWDLEKLEEKLKETDLNDITSKLVVQRVAVVFPKFSIEFDVNLKDTFKSMGGSSMFGKNANLSGIFKDANPQKMWNIKHKVFLDFNEGGSNVVVNSEANPEPVFLDPRQKFFVAIRPFFFIIRNKSTTFFVGHVTRF